MFNESRHTYKCHYAYLRIVWGKEEITGPTLMRVSEAAIESFNNRWAVASGWVNYERHCKWYKLIYQRFPANYIPF